MDGPQRDVDLDVAETQRCRVGVPGTRGSPARGTHARQQFADAERLGQVVVCPGVERRDLVGLPRSRRQHDDRRLRPTAEVADELDAVAVGQAQVEDHQFGPARGGVGQRLPDGVGFDHVPALALERHADEAPDLALVLDQQCQRRGVAHAADAG